MKYLLLVYCDERKLTEVDDAECLDHEAALVASGRQVAAEALQPVRTATTVRVRDGGTSITDGPFAETKEQLTGFYLVEAGDLDEALEMAARIPPARVGSIEVRPIRPIRETSARRGRGASPPDAGAEERAPGSDP